MLFPVAVTSLIVLVVELVLFSKVAGLIGGLAAVFCLFGLSLLGLSLLRRRTGRVLLSTIDQVSQSGRLDAAVVADSSLLLSAAILLIVPGFVTGALGAALLLPPVRALVRPLVRSLVPDFAEFNSRFRGRQDRGGVIDVDIIGGDHYGADENATGSPKAAGLELDQRPGETR